MRICYLNIGQTVRAIGMLGEKMFEHINMEASIHKILGLLCIVSRAANS